MQPHLDIPGIELERSVGQGAASLVFRGRRRVEREVSDADDEAGPQLVAVKLFTPAPHVSAEALRQRVVREAALLASLNHRGLAKIYEVGEHVGRPYIVMEFIEGRSLASALAARGGAMPCPRVIAIGHAVAEVLDHVWRRGLVHRDLKPSNVLIDTGGAVKLIDFGFAELWSRDPSGWGDSKARSRPVGTFTYSAPEQTGILRRPVDGRADLYALGALLYECATGRPPFVAEDVGSLLHMHAAVRPEDPRARNPAIPSGLAAIIMRLLRKDPEERYQAAASLLADLDRVDALTRQLDVYPSARDDDAPAPAELVEERVDPPLGALSAPRGDDLSPLLRAREPELVGLLDRWRAALEGRGSFVVLTGPPGAGAHPLCAGLIERAGASTRAIVLRGRCDEELNLAFAPLVQALVGFMSDSAGGRSAIVARRGLIRTAAGDSRAALAKLSPRLAGLLGVSTASAGTRDGHNAEQVFALERVLHALSEIGGPVLLVLEDVQWLDEASREVVTALRRRLDDRSPPPLLLVCTTRQSSRASDPPRPRDAELPAEILLRPLALSAARRVIVDSLGRAPVDESIVRAVLARSGEQPETIVECVRTMLSAGVLRPSWGRWELDAARLPELGLPGDMAALVLHRLSDIAASDREVLRWAAVVGPRFSLAHLPSIIERDADKVVRAFENANAVGVIERVHGDEYSFVHPSIRAALLAELSGAQRRACHLRIALTLDEVPTLTAAQLFARARHYAEALDRETARRAFETNRAAGALALRTHAPEHAYQFLAAALQARMIGGLGEDLDLYETLGDVCQRTYRYRQAEAHFRHLLERRERPAARAKVCAKLASVHAAAPDVAAARAVVKRGLEELEPEERAGESAGLRGAVGRLRRSVERAAASRLGAAGERREGLVAGVSLRRWASELDRAELDLDRALSRIKRALASARALGDGPDRVRLENAAARAWAAHGYIGRAEELNERAQVGAARLDDPALVGESLLTGALLREHAGDPLGAASQVERALADYGARVDPWLASEGYVTLGWNLILRGHVRRARSFMLRAGRRCAGAGLRTRTRPPRAGVASMVAACEALLGRSAESRERFELAHERLVDHDVGRTLRALHSLMRALVFVEDGAFTGALELEGVLIRALESAGLPVERTPLLLRPMWLLRARQRLTLLEAALDRAGDRARNQERVQLREELDRALEDLGPNARGLPALRCQQRVLVAARLRLDGAREGAASDAFARAVELLGRAQSTAFVIDSPWAQFEVHRERARLLATMGHAAAARREAGAALQLAHHEGWAPRARRIRAEFELADPALQVRGDIGLSSSSLTSGGGVRDGGVTSEEVAPAPGQLLRQRSSGGAGALDRCFDALLEVSRTAVARGSGGVGAQARRLLDALISAMGAERALLFVSEDESSDRGGGYLRRIAGRDSRGRDLDRDDRYCTTVIEHVVATRAVKVVGGSDDSEFTGSESVEALGLKSIVCAPLLVQDRLIGVVYLDNRLVRGLFAPEDRRLLVAMCNHIAIALESSRMNRFMRATRDEALEASRLKSAFLTHMSHELRTPLNAVIGYSEILAEDLATRAPDALPDLARIGDAGKRLLELISDVLDLAKLESGKLELHRARFEIRPLVDELVASVADELERNNNDLQVTCPPSIGALYSDRASVLRVLRAVLGNAAKFTHRGVIELDVRWHAKQGGKQLACEIRDSGIGMSPDDVGRLFTEFSQADMSTTREYGGAGLGLAISQRLCALLGGSIHVESQQGRGSTFTVVLPDSDPPRAQQAV